MVDRFMAQLTLNLRKTFHGDHDDSSTAIESISAHISFTTPSRSLAQEQRRRRKEATSGVTRFMMGEGEFSVDPYTISSANTDDTHELETLPGDRRTLPGDRRHSTRDLEWEVIPSSRFSRAR